MGLFSRFCGAADDLVGDADVGNLRGHADGVRDLP
jgi:hypothetical protein